MFLSKILYTTPQVKSEVLLFKNILLVQANIKGYQENPITVTKVNKSLSTSTKKSIFLINTCPIN